MFSPSEFREIVSGRRCDLVAAGYRFVAGWAEPIVRWYTHRRNRRFDSGVTPTTRVVAPVISIGNLTVGGVGKTPLVAWVANFVRAQGRTPVLISRGYGRRDDKLNDGLNDEGMELARRLPDVKHWQNADRVAAAQAALAEVPEAVLVLDDAFQHRRIARDLDIVMLDALEPFGFDHVLPRGTLREPVEGLARADVVLLSRGDLLSKDERAAIRARVASLAPQALWGVVVHRPTRLVRNDGATETLESLAGKRAFAFCGLGNPAGFRQTLAGLSLAAWELEEFPDHHQYTENDLARVAQRAKSSGADLVLCTAKDLVKTTDSRLGDIPLWAVEIDIGFLEGEEGLKDAIAMRLRLDCESREKGR
jgi:tetraacyldisaccharide 4'-kinase